MQKEFYQYSVNEFIGVDFAAKQPDLSQAQSTFSVLEDINVNDIKRGLEARFSTEEIHQPRNQEDQIESQQNNCVFCSKDYQKFKGRQEKLNNLDKDDLKAAVEPLSKFINDTAVHKQLEEAEI